MARVLLRAGDQEVPMGMRAAQAVCFMIGSATLLGCSSTSPPVPVATVQRVAGVYYLVNLNTGTASPYEVGRQYALQIAANQPEFESRVDSFLGFMIGLLNHPPDVTITFDDLNARAHDIFPNIPAEYQEEIRGMQSVFSYTTNAIGDERLSQDELLVYQLFADVARVNSCSASAAFGGGTTSGKTIVGRNLEWKAGSNAYLSALHAVVVFHNGAKSLVSIGFLGQLSVVSAYNFHKIFAATLDSENYQRPYPSTRGKGSYVMDLRYALENQTTVGGVANYLSTKSYAFNFNIFLADGSTAAVFEDNSTTSFSGLRSATSTLKPGIPTWGYSDAIAAVNCFMLPGTEDNCSLWIGNPKRWQTFGTLYGTALQGKVGLDTMKEIAGYPGTDGDATSGAIFRSDDEPEMQVVVADLGTLETWVFFQPEGNPLRNPLYIQVFAGSPF